MNLFNEIKERILRKKSLEKLTDNPNDDRYTFLSDEEKLKQRKIQEYKVWYYGDSDELLNFYTTADVYKNMEDPIYNRNKTQYFWGLAAEECNIKRVHSGMGNAIITTLTNIVGIPSITSKDQLMQEKIDKILKETQFKNIMNQKQIPLTLACGWGCYKPVIDKDISNYPLIEWYDADDVDFIVKHDIIIGAVFKDYYKYKNKDYVLIETRRTKNGNSFIEYNLYKLEKNDDVVEVELDTIPELANLPKDGLVINGYNKVLAVPSIFFYDTYNKNYGKSILAGKIDMLDDLDQDLSQASQTSRVSTPVEYFPVDNIERSRDGRPRLPQVYNRQYVASDCYPNGDGELSGQIITTQPQLNFEQYNGKCLADLDFILTGILSPASLGLNVAKDDTALSQREKEKITLMMRNNIIDRQINIACDLINMELDLLEYMETNNITLGERDISVKFEEFCNPSFETVSQTLSNLLANNAITPELYVEKLYGDSLSDEEKAREVAYIKERQQADTLDFGDFDNDEQFTANPEQQETDKVGIAEAE